MRTQTGTTANRLGSAFMATVMGLVILGLFVVPAQAHAQTKQGQRMADPVAFYFPGYDKNGDGTIDLVEWQRRGNFELLDVNKDGGIDRNELAAMYGTFGKNWTLLNPILPSASPVFDSSIQVDQVSQQTIGKKATCIVTRFSQCEDVDALASQAGLMETGLGPIFPPDAFCLGIDEVFAEPYTDKTGKGMHGGIDIPTDFGTPILAVASGTVVAKIEDEFQLRGKTVVLRHGPGDTGLPFWVYTEYGHMHELPTQAIGQRVRMGEVLGPTGNTGVKPGSRTNDTARRPGIHFAVYYSKTPRYFSAPKYVLPERVQWMDPHGLYRQRAPFDSQSLKDLPENEKAVEVPIMYLDGVTKPADTKLVWPYACRPADGRK